MESEGKPELSLTLGKTPAAIDICSVAGRARLGAADDLDIPAAVSLAWPAGLRPVWSCTGGDRGRRLRVVVWLVEGE